MQVEFSFQANQQKPVTINKNGISCPFCDREQMEIIIEERGPYKWIVNKYQTLTDTDMTLIIETEKCGHDLGDYSDDYVKDLWKFTIEKYEEMKADPQYKSVILFKNYGFLSGGSLSHPHMQIIGFRSIDAKNKITKKNLTGYPVIESPIRIDVSEEPVVNFVEYNFHFNQVEIGSMTKLLQRFVKGQLKANEHREYGYNLFLYELNDQYVLKYTPRHPVSPYYIGYNIKQVIKTDELLIAMDKIRQQLS